MSLRKFLLLAVLCALPLGVARTQSQNLIIVPAANASATPSAKVVAVPDVPESLQAAIKLLEEMKAANAAALKKQEETLQRLDELQKAADQLKIYTQRT